MLTKTIEKGVNSHVMEKAGITVGHLKKLKQSIRVIMFLSRAKSGALSSLVRKSKEDENAEDENAEDDEPGAEEEEQQQQSEAAGSGAEAEDNDKAASPSASVPRLNLAALLHSREQQQQQQQQQPGPSAAAAAAPALTATTGRDTPDSDRGQTAPLTGWATDRSVDGRSVRQVGYAEAATTSLPVMPSSATAGYSPQKSMSKSNSMSSMGQEKTTSPGHQGMMPPVKPLAGRRGSHQLMQAPDDALYSRNRDYTAFATHRPSAAPKETGMFSQQMKVNAAPEDLYGIGFSPDAPSHWTPRGGRANTSLPNMPDTSWVLGRRPQPPHCCVLPAPDDRPERLPDGPGAVAAPPSRSSGAPQGPDDARQGHHGGRLVH